MPTNPTSALGMSRVMPSSMPRPGPQDGHHQRAWAGEVHAVREATGVWISRGSTRTSRVAS